MHHDGISIERPTPATVRIEGDGTVVYVDPLGAVDGGDADVVCVTHGHHYDPDAVRAVAAEGATLVLFEGIDTGRIDRDVDRPVDLPLEIRRIDAEADFAVGSLIVRTTAAHNDPDGDRSGGLPHPPGRGCGYHLTLAGVSVYCPGDTDVLAGHDRLDVDVFCPPIEGETTMDRRDAAALAAALKPDLVVPLRGGEEDIEAFAEGLRDRGVAVRSDP